MFPRCWLGPCAAYVSFPTRPPEHIIAAVKAAGFRWEWHQHHWYRARITGAQDFFTWLQRECAEGRAAA